MFFLLIVELIFATIFVQSDGGNRTLVSKRWHQEYWHPINTQGYRDYEHNWDKPTVFILGDSFIAGHGINNIDDRLASQLAKKLEGKWTVAIVAKNGWSTADEYQALINHQQKPQRIIVSYYLNDIANAANKHGLKRQVKNAKPPELIRPLVNNSYLFNWYYWKLRILKLNSGVSSRKGYFEQAYNNEKIWLTHSQEIQNIIDYARAIDAPISFIVWPRLPDVEGSLKLTMKVTDFLEQQQVDVINLTDIFIGRQAQALVVNPWDGHPNVAVNREVAELLYQRLRPWH